MQQKIAVIAAMIFGISFSLYGNCRDKIQPLVQLLTSILNNSLRYSLRRQTYLPQRQFPGYHGLNKHLSAILCALSLKLLKRNLVMIDLPYQITIHHTSCYRCGSVLVILHDWLYFDNEKHFILSPVCLLLINSTLLFFCTQALGKLSVLLRL